MSDRTILETMAAFSASLRLESLPTQVVDKLKICIYDALECCLSPMEDQRTRAALQSVPRSPALPATLFGTKERAYAADAAFVNTVKGAVTSRNDSSRTAICHPGSVLIPVVFALGEENSLSGRRVLEALAVGYETTIRLGATLVAAKINRSWRNTSLVAPFGAAFCAAKIMGMSEKSTAAAASFSCHFAGGVNEWAVAGTGEDVFQNGWGARNGILAMNLAMGGAPGCTTILEGKSGLLNALGATETASYLTDGLGQRYDTLEIMHKPIDCCFMVQGPSQTAQKLLASAPGLLPGDIEHIRIQVAGQAKHYPGCDNAREIGSLVQGIMSIQLGVCSTLVGGGCNHIRWEPPIDPAILALMRKCELIEDAEMTRSFPQLQGARVTVTTRDGKEYSAEQRDVIPLTHAQVKERFLATAAARLGEARTQTLEQKIAQLENVEDIGELAALLVP